mgnify:CR=1 FL=1
MRALYNININNEGPIAKVIYEGHIRRNKNERKDEGPFIAKP